MPVLHESISGAGAAAVEGLTRPGGGGPTRGEEPPSERWPFVRGGPGRDYFRAGGSGCARNVQRIARPPSCRTDCDRPAGCFSPPAICHGAGGSCTGARNSCYLYNLHFTRQVKGAANFDCQGGHLSISPPAIRRFVRAVREARWRSRHRWARLMHSCNTLVPAAASAISPPSSGEKMRRVAIVLVLLQAAAGVCVPGHVGGNDF